ncbi:MAG: 23S rRNA pseudouridine(1911/1915/1917) synthase RluD [SAR86 cluster bacterium]|uniref:Pseudouridine synthase n=1 Tax=SAR86 cluster bacterium TaxID=2030880 RepID=A0A2A5AEW4_9GAMM|nr:MAG: 23S rRNA pseudouridine(1911/1915/1917) synthase RluD [SAR86 cluster bacterium]
MTSHISLQAEVPDELSGNRLDQIAAKLFPEYSRARLQSWIKEGLLLVNSRQLRPRDRLQTGDKLVIEAELAVMEDWVAREMDIDIVFEDEHLIVVNKATNVVVHPAIGHRDDTLLNGLLHHCPDLKKLPRAGIVHRLDKDTTGLMVVAKSLVAHASLVNQLQAHEVSREYEAVVHGVLTGGGTIDAPLGRHPVNRKKRAIVEGGQEAITHYRVIQRYRSYTHVDVKLETGRTHQIRVHLAHLKHTIVGDQMYGGRLQLPSACSVELRNYLQNFKRQALHAKRLAFLHPLDQKEVSWEVPRPQDMNELISQLANDS